MLKKLAKLIDVKSLVTLALTAVFCVLAIRRDVSVEHFLTVYTVIIAFYFGVQYEKHRNKADEEEGDSGGLE
jgi:Flp pilus assembly protein TadB